MNKEEKGIYEYRYLNGREYRFIGLTEDQLWEIDKAIINIKIKDRYISESCDWKHANRGEMLEEDGKHI